MEKLTRINDLIVEEDAAALLAFAQSQTWDDLSNEELHEIVELAALYGDSGRTTRYRELTDFFWPKLNPATVQLCALLERNEEAERSLKRNPGLIHSQDKQGRTPLHCGALRGNSTIAKLLCEHGAIVDAVDNRGETPLDHALHAGPWKSEPASDVASLLLEFGANVDFWTRCALGESTDLASVLRHEGRAVNDRDSNGRTALFHAVHNNHPQAVRALLDLDADPNAANADGETPLASACLHSMSQECEPAILDALLEAGATMTLPAAVITTNVEAISRLVREAGTDSLDSDERFSGLDYAIHVWRPESLKRLLRAGLRPTEEQWVHIRRIGGNDAALIRELEGLSRR